MIKSIRLQNFFGFQDCTVNLEKGANVLIGINGSGKSNFLKAFYLMENAMIRRLNSQINRTWRGIDDLLNKTGSTDFAEISFQIAPRSFASIISSNNVSLSYSIQIERFQQADYRLHETAQFFEGGTGVPIFSISNGKSSFWVAKGKTLDAGKIQSSEFAKESILFSHLADDIVPYFSTIKDEFSGIVCYSGFDTLEDSQMRKSAPPILDEQLDAWGDNLVSVLNNLKVNYREGFKKIEDCLKVVNPNFDEIEFIHSNNQLELSLIEKNLGSRVSPQHVSDGTLRFLCLMVILYNPNRGSVVCIDEPETGLHPDMIRTVAEAIKFAAETSQVIVSTHSTELLNHFDLENVRVFEKDENNATVVNQFTSVEFSDFMDRYMVGQLWRQGHLGGNRW